MNANSLKQDTLAFMESLEGMTSIHHAAGKFTMSMRAGQHFLSLRDQGFPIPAHAERHVEPVAFCRDTPIYTPEPEVEPTPPQDPIDGNYYATQIVEHLRHFLPKAATNYKSVGKHYAVTSAAAMADRGEAIKGLLYAVVELAAEEGVIVTIERKPFPDGKLAMGHAMTCIETRWERKIYQHFMSLGDTEKVMLKTTDELNRELAQFEWDQRSDWQRENGGGKRETYMELGWIVNGRVIKTEDELTEYLRKTAIAVDISLFKPVPPPAPEVEWTWPAAEAEPVPELLQDQYTEDEYCSHCGQVIVDAEEDEGSQIPSQEVLAEMPILPPPEALATITSLMERGTPLATKLSDAALSKIYGMRPVVVKARDLELGDGSSPIAMGHPYAPYPGRDAIIDGVNSYIDKVKDQRGIPVTMNPDGSIEYYPV